MISEADVGARTVRVLEGLSWIAVEIDANCTRQNSTSGCREVNLYPCNYIRETEGEDCVCEWVSARVLVLVLAGSRRPRANNREQEKKISGDCRKEK